MAQLSDWTFKDHTIDCRVGAYSTPALSADERREVTRAKCVRKVARALPKCRVAISDVTPTQNWVGRAAAEALAADTTLADGAREPAILVRKAGRAWLFDGHHRLVAGMLAGDDEISVHVKDFDQPRPCPVPGCG